MATDLYSVIKNTFRIILVIYGQSEKSRDPRLGCDPEFDNPCCYVFRPGLL
jgi:hypothetical protein